jgi:RNA polymerase sigma-70 factor (ECF subfamily)
MIENSAEISIEALRAGDRLQFARLVDTYSNPIYGLGLKMLGNVQDAEDVLQTTFLKALQHISAFEGRASLSTWLYRIAANEALMLMRRKRPAISLDEEPEDGDGEVMQPMQLADWSAGAMPESVLVSAETSLHLDCAIQNLPAKLRIVFVMRDIQGLSIKETGDVLDLSETAVKTRLLRARLHLREQLSDYFGERLRQEKQDEPRT